MVNSVLPDAEAQPWRALVCGVEEGWQPEDAPRCFSEVIHLVFETGPHWSGGHLGTRLSLLSQAWDYKSARCPDLFS